MIEHYVLILLMLLLHRLPNDLVHVYLALDVLRLEAPLPELLQHGVGLELASVEYVELIDKVPSILLSHLEDALLRLGLLLAIVDPVLALVPRNCQQELVSLLLVGHLIALVLLQLVVAQEVVVVITFVRQSLCILDLLILYHDSGGRQVVH